jgi:prevent-host-death family protein
MTWGATQAKAKFSEVLDRAEREGPQIVHRRKHEFVLMKKEEYDALPKDATGAEAAKQAQSLVAFFRNSPAYGLNATFKRIKLRSRKVKF